MVCWNCGNALPVNCPENHACQSCADEYEADEAWREQGYLEARERRAATREAEWEQIREQRREQRQAEQDAYELLREERRSARLNEEKAEWDAFLRSLAQMQMEGYHE